MVWCAGAVPYPFAGKVKQMVRSRCSNLLGFMWMSVPETMVCSAASSSSRSTLGSIACVCSHVFSIGAPPTTVMRSQSGKW